MSNKFRRKPRNGPKKFFDKKDTNFCVYEVHSKPKKTVYHLRGSQSKYLERLILEGYDGLPPGLYLYKGGYGFGKKGTFLLSALKTHISENKKLDLIISNKNIKSVIKKLGITIVRLPYQDVRNLLIKLGRINEDNNQELRESVASFLSTKFPRRIKISSVNFDDYKGGEMAALLRRKQVAKKINEEDLQSLKTFFPKIFEISLKGRRKMVRIERNALIKNTKNITDKIFLDEVIKEFQINLLKKNLSEQIWQDFLREKVFRFMANYVTSIEKQNISLDVSYPDFVLADVYGFIDIFEIKKHNAPLLSFDKSHENYYWRPEMAMAISQIENYIDKIIHNSNDYVRVIKRKKGIDIKVVRPRGYIIAGNSKQFKNEKEFEDFRKLSSSLKNISFILYDELFENLKNLRSKL